MSKQDKRRHLVVYTRTPKILEAVSCPIVRQFKVYYSGWDSDNVGYVVEHEGRNRLVLTNHGAPYFAPTSELSIMARELEAAVAVMNEAILDCTG